MDARADVSPEGAQLDREWASLNARLLAGLPPVATDLTNGSGGSAEAYVLDWMDDAHDGEFSVAAQVNGSIACAGEPMDEVWSALDQLSGVVLAGGRGPFFTATFLLEPDFDSEVLREWVMVAFVDSAAEVVVNEVRRVDLATLGAEIRTASGITCRPLDVLAAAFFAGHGLDPRRLILLEAGEGCAFPDQAHECEQSFWRDVHAGYREGLIGRPYLH